MKRWSCTLILIALLAVLTACGKQPENAAAPTTDRAASPETTDRTSAPQTETPTAASAEQATEPTAVTEPVPEAAPGYKLY